jgi:hypothetical protein
MPELESVDLDDAELVEKYCRIKELAQQEFPNGKYFIEITTWTDGDFQIAAVHNRTFLLGGRWSCKIRISCEESNGPTGPYRYVSYQDEQDVIENTVWHGDW